MLDKRGAVPAAVFAERGAAVKTVFIPITAQDQAVLLIERQVVLPVDRVAIGVEHTEVSAELVAFGVAVFAVAQLHAGLPGLVELGVDVRAGAADGVVGIGLLADTLPGSEIIATKAVVIFRLAPAIQQVETHLQLIAELMAQVQAQRLIAIGIMVAVAGEGGVAPVDTGGVIQARAQVEARAFIAARQAQAAFPGVVAAKAQLQARLQAWSGIAAGKYLDHPANRIAAVNHRARPAQHFHPLNLINIQVLQAAVAGSAIGNPLAIHQHQALRGLGATYENPRQAAPATGARHLHAGHAAEQVGQAGGLQAVDIVPGKHGVGSTAVIACLHLAVGADHHIGELQGGVAGVGEQVRSGQEQEWQGKSKVLHGPSMDSKAIQNKCGSWLACDRITRSL